MTDASEGKTQGYEITCRDNSKGRLTAESEAEAIKGGQDMCDIHGGVKGATPRQFGKTE